MDKSELQWEIAESLQRQGQYRTQQDIRATLENIARQHVGVAECPWCAGPIPRKGVEVCKHCGRDLAWAEAPSNPVVFICCKPNDLEGWALAIARWELDEKEKHEAIEKEKTRKAQEAEHFRKKIPVFLDFH